MYEKPVQTFVGSEDLAITDEPTLVYWLSVGGDVGERGYVYLRDGFSTSDEIKWQSYVYNGGHFLFNPPIRFAHGLYIDIDTAAIKLYTIGYLFERIVLGKE